MFTQSIIALHFELHMPVCAFIVAREEGGICGCFCQPMSVPVAPIILSGIILSGCTVHSVLRFYPHSLTTHSLPSLPSLSPSLPPSPPSLSPSLPPLPYLPSQESGDADRGLHTQYQRHIHRTLDALGGDRSTRKFWKCGQLGDILRGHSR